jgi:hypothetical protein
MMRERGRDVNAQDRLRQAIERQEDLLRAAVPSDRHGAILALVRVLDRLPPAAAEPEPDLVTGRRVADLGGNRALRLCLESNGEDSQSGTTMTGDELERWAPRFLRGCAELDAAGLVLAHCETGFMRLVDDDHGRFDAWIATKLTPASWRERADIAWWAAWLTERHELEINTLRSRLTLEQSPDAAARLYRRLADGLLAMMMYQLTYPPDASLGGCTIQRYRDVLARLIADALAARGRGEEPVAQPESSLIAALALSLDTDPAVIASAVGALTLDAGNAAYHAAVPGVAAAPLVRVGPDRLVLSVHGLTTQPFFFLIRELRRRDPDAYNTGAFLREDVFRQDLYALFADKRFVTSSRRIALRKDGKEDRDLRTDIDAVVFDRKTGALGLFELKSQDPFARSAAEIARQRDAVLYANRQISGALAWLSSRHGGDALLTRVDPRTAKTFRVQKVYPFVLGRYLVSFPDGPEPDKRAAWGSWPQILRLLDGQPFRGTDTNPLATLFARLAKDDSPVHAPLDIPPREITVGDARLVVYPSYAAYQTATPSEPAR